MSDLDCQADWLWNKLRDPALGVRIERITMC